MSRCLCCAQYKAEKPLNAVINAESSLCKVLRTSHHVLTLNGTSMSLYHPCSSSGNVIKGGRNNIRARGCKEMLWNALVWIRHCCCTPPATVVPLDMDMAATHMKSQQFL